MKLTTKDFLKLRPKIKTVGQMKIGNKNIYKNIRGHENEINYKIYDMPRKKSGLSDLIVSITKISSGKINGEHRMTTGHSHRVADEVYHFLSGSGSMIVGRKKVKVKKGITVTVPKKNWHRVINTGKNELIFLTIFESSGNKERGVNK